MPVTFSATSRNSNCELKVTAVSYRAKHCLTPGILAAPWVHGTRGENAEAVRDKDYQG